MLILSLLHLQKILLILLVFELLDFDKKSIMHVASVRFDRYFQHAVTNCQFPVAEISDWITIADNHLSTDKKR